MKIFRLILIMMLLAGITSCEEESFNVPLASSQAKFSYTMNNNGNAPSTVTFINESINATGYSWDFGNGQTSTEENPSVTYDSAGTYTATLTITAQNQGLHYSTIEYSKSINVKEKPIRRLYFSCRILGNVKYVELDDSPFPIIQEFSHSGIGKPYGMTIDTARAMVYVTDYKYQYLYKYDRDGTEVEVLMTEPTPNFDSPFGILAIENHIYWADSAGIHRANLDGTNPEVFIDITGTKCEMPLEIDYDHTNKQFYIANDKYEFSGGIFRVDFDGSNLTELVAGTNAGAIGIDVPNNRMYYYDYDQGMCLNTLDGQNEVVFDPTNAGSMCWGMAVDAEGGKIYYSNRVDMTVMRANLDGSGVEVFIPAEAEINPNAMTIDKAR